MEACPVYWGGGYFSSTRGLCSRDALPFPPKMWLSEVSPDIAKYPPGEQNHPHLGKHWDNVIYDLYSAVPLPKRWANWVSFTKKFWSYHLSQGRALLRSPFQREWKTGWGQALPMLLSANDLTQQRHWSWAISAQHGIPQMSNIYLSSPWPGWDLLRAPLQSEALST